MKRFIGYLGGILVLLMVFAIVFVATGIYDNATKIKIEPYFLRTALTGVSATDVPRTIDDVGQRRLRDWLIQKFVVEYFYVVPDIENVAQRERAGGLQSVLYYMSNSNVFKKWVNDVVPDLRQMASDGVMRTVTVFDEILKPNPDSNYYLVEYELKTWYNPNDMTTAPEITRGKMYVSVIGGTNGIQPVENIRMALEKGLDPAVVFTFQVNDVQFERE